MEDLETKNIGKNAIKSVFALTTRTAILQIIAFVANFFLTVLLSPEIFGVFFLVSAVVSFLNYFSDIGLAAALVQKKGGVSEIELRTTFTIQQILVGSLTILAFVLSPFIQTFFRFSSEGVFLFQALIVSFFLTSLKTIPSILLERKLQFDKLVIPQILETLLFHITAVVLAYLGWGIHAFTVAVLMRSVVGLIAIYVVAPWRPGIALDRDAARKLLSFGVPFQINSVLALIKDDLFTIYLGRVLPLAQIGYIGWAKKWAELPLRLIMDNIIKVTFPAYSRLQHDPVRLKKAIESALFFLVLLAVPITLVMISVMRPFIDIVPRYEKWYPALFSFYLFCLSSLLSTITGPLTNVFNSTGHVKKTLVFMVVWTVMTWTIIPAMIPTFGFNAVALGMFIISLSVIVIAYLAKRLTHITYRYSIGKPLLTAIPLAVYLLVISLLPVSGVLQIALLLLGGGSVWALTVYIFAKQDISHVIHTVRNRIQ